VILGGRPACDEGIRARIEKRAALSDTFGARRIKRIVVILAKFD
jgi:hypothetical protein